MLAILNQAQEYDFSLANAVKLKMVQLPSETQRSAISVEKSYCACSLFAGRLFSLGFALMGTGLHMWYLPVNLPMRTIKVIFQNLYLFPPIVCKLVIPPPSPFTSSLQSPSTTFPLESSLSTKPVDIYMAFSVSCK